MQPPMWGFLQPCLLLLLAEEPRHGYALMDELGRRRLLEQEIDVGNLYRALRRMEAEGLVTSAWSDRESGPYKRVYEIAPAGEEMLRGWAGALEQRLRLLNGFLAEYRRLSGPAPDPAPGPPRDPTRP